MRKEKKESKMISSLRGGRNPQLQKIEKAAPMHPKSVAPGSRIKALLTYQRRKNHTILLSFFFSSFFLFLSFFFFLSLTSCIERTTSHSDLHCFTVGHLA